MPARRHGAIDWCCGMTKQKIFGGLRSGRAVGCIFQQHPPKALLVHVTAKAPGSMRTSTFDRELGGIAVRDEASGLRHANSTHRATAQGGSRTVTACKSAPVTALARWRHVGTTPEPSCHHVHTACAANAKLKRCQVASGGLSRKGIPWIHPPPQRRRAKPRQSTQVKLRHVWPGGLASLHPR